MQVNLATRGGRGRGRGCVGFEHSRQSQSRDSREHQGSNNYIKPTCQVCGKIGHVALKCYHRFDHSYQLKETKIAAVHTSPGYMVDTNWYTDTGATDHITGVIDRLTTREKYGGKDQVQAANGSGMHISHIGHSQIHSSCQTLHLKNILHVPKASKNLLSVHKFAADNDVMFEFYTTHFAIKDLPTRKVLLRGRCKGGLYPLPSDDATTTKSAFSSIKTSHKQWHCRLGHPSSAVIQQVVQLNKLPCSSNNKDTFVCDACQCVKSHQLPFSFSNNVSSLPLELVFSNVWGPALTFI
ncbi:RNA-directed DNA polymerase protein [Dioscorea alata]|uniref:RNA-directed DNA polymerase protein n=1 Tax=Dioscorea alata TaxID=55571 RepID=A0ACB7UES1_DIOAL|nr:RNA-directed DNA polymerase protein [Dioscorea alata]